MSVISKERFATGFQWTAYMQDSAKNLERFHENHDDFTLEQDDADFFSHLTSSVNVLILAEDWCGDVVQSLPPIVRILEQTPHLEYRIFKRDENPDIMDQYLTDGSKAIPFLVFMDQDLNERAQWGPRPADCQAIMRNNKGKIPMDKIYPQLRAWYKENGNCPLVQEIRAILEQI